MKCPYTGLKKDCVGDECELWDVYPISEISKTTGQKVIKEKGMCTHKWQTKIAFDAAGFTDYMGKSMDKLRNIAEGSTRPILRLNGDDLGRLEHGN